MKTSIASTILGLLFAIGWLGAPASAGAATSFQTSLVPVEADSAPGFSSRGSSIKIVSGNNQLQVKGKVKKVVNEDGDPVTTERSDSDDDYKVEIDLFVPATDRSGTVPVAFELKNGNGGFKTRVSRSDPAFEDAMKGDGVIVEGVRVFDASGELIGVGGVSLRVR
jgi:hypothetical protein